MRAILAPHPDDEIIGCYRILKHKLIDTVFFLNCESEKRKQEAIKSSEYFHFTPVFNMEKVVKYFLNNKIDILYAPTIKDYHPVHKYANELARQSKARKKVFYTIEKNTAFEVLNDLEIRDKEFLLNDIYPSQSLLWKYDKKYILFEGYTEKEYKTKIFIRTEFTGLHYWENCDIKKVGFLKHPHRHHVLIEVVISVKDEEREIEFFMFKRDIDRIIRTLYGADKFIKDLGNRSIETVATDIYKVLSKKHPAREIKVIASEDGEVGAIIE